MPWVGRARFENEREARRVEMADRLVAEARLERERELTADLKAQNAALFNAYAALRVSGANAPEPDKIIPPPKRPPAIVYRAMRAISPRDDATFAANWRLWEENQEECDKDPEAFANRIKRGRMTPETPGAD